MRNGGVWFALLAAGVAYGQGNEPIRQATIKGSRGTSGKCTIEVRVDITAEVDIYGDSGRLRTLAGQPATWTRMECSDPLPYQMSDFRFKGIDGRGQMRLEQDPRNHNSMAVIHIEDSKGGAEGYTFDIEWSGASGGAPSGFRTGAAPQAQPQQGRLPERTAIRGSNRTITNEQAIDACRTELRTRSERDYGLRNIDITAAVASTDRRGWISGTFQQGNAMFRRGNPYKFQCEVDFNSGQVGTIEIVRPDGSTMQPGGGSGAGAPTGAALAGVDQNRALRACQDAVVARTNRDGYQNVNFTATAVDRGRAEWISGSLTASRGPVTDTFDFGCSMDMQAGRVRNLEFNRR